MRLQWMVVGLLACAGPEQVACEEACITLVDECRFEAFPNRDSCIEGCLGSASQGAAVGLFEACIYDASCDPFTVAACAQQTGAEP